MGNELFPEIDRHERPAPAPDAPVRYETANRQQVELTPTDLESLLPPGHAARLVWRFVEGVDLTAFYTAIKAREGGPGRPPIDPKILVALWLYATIDGVGSARELDRLCTCHDAYRWLRGGVSVNYHTLSDFRLGHARALDHLLTQSIAALLRRGIVTLARVAQDGTRVRASAGTGSFRRGPTVATCLAQAQRQVARVQQTPAASARHQAARQRAAADRLARVEAALAELPAIEAVKARHGRRQRPRSAARVSTTDPQARVMKMADGGFRPAYNIQLATDVAGRAIVGVHVTNVGSDRHLLPPMLTDLARRTGRVPDEYLVDGGLMQRDVITDCAAQGITVLCPEPVTTARPPGTPVPEDSAAVRAWRARMQTPEAQTRYKDRAATAEWTNAQLRTHRTLDRPLVRGLYKLHTWTLWCALAHNMLALMGIVPHLMT